jgi:ketosteroid isomerase-like protein
MGIEANKRVVLEFLERQYAHRIPEAFELVADDATWWMPGNLPFSGTYTKEQIQAVFEGVLDRFVAAPEMEVLTVTAEDDRVAVEVEGRGTMRSGLDYFNTYHMLFRVRDGKITSCRNHQDLNHLREITEAEVDEVKAPGA